MVEDARKFKPDLIKIEAQTTWQETVRWYFDTLALGEMRGGKYDLSFLRGKRILDQGAGNGAFGAWLEAQNVGAKVISLDYSAHRYERKGFPWESAPEHTIVTGDARDLSFIPDNSIDLVLAEASVPYFFVDWISSRYPNEEEDEGFALDWVRAGKAEDVPGALKAVFSEQLRVMKPGAEARMWPMYTAGGETLTAFNRMVGTAFEEVSRSYNFDAGPVPYTEEFAGLGFRYALSIVKK